VWSVYYNFIHTKFGKPTACSTYSDVKQKCSRGFFVKTAGVMSKIIRVWNKMLASLLVVFI